MIDLTERLQKLEKENSLLKQKIKKLQHDFVSQSELHGKDQSFLQSLVKENKLLQAKLKRSESNRIQLEEIKDKDQSLLKTLNREIEEARFRLRAIKEEQDGDYFLTSLLIKPLSVNYSKSEFVDVEFFVKQKKQFKFKQWESEIGGDICISHSISLNNKPFTLFLNADAMGKSLQGASGTLVLGTVLREMIERTFEEDKTQNLCPEDWLKCIYNKLQSIFDAFDGNMLVTLLLGIIDDNEGIIYYLNAEHPKIVLYRDKVASFIENEYFDPRLGKSEGGNFGNVNVQEFQLIPKDIIIIGSDGKDDILLEKKDDARVINDDEYLFLQHVEESSGNLQKIYEATINRGEIIDDFSLLRLEYKKYD